MGMVAYLDLKEGGIEGSCRVADRDGTIEVIAFNHSLVLPVNELDGAITGNRRHGHVEIVKLFDKSSPLLYESLVNGKQIPSGKLSWYTVDEMAGIEKEYFTHEWQVMRVVSVEPFMLNCHAHPEMNHMERVRFRYEKIIWTYVDGGIIAEDSWFEAR